MTVPIPRLKPIFSDNTLGIIRHFDQNPDTDERGDPPQT